MAKNNNKKANIKKTGVKENITKKNINTEKIKKDDIQQENIQQKTVKKSEGFLANPNTKRITKTGGILCLITAAAALLLSAVNSFTAPVIAENTVKKTNEAMKKIMEDADSFERAKYILTEDTADVTDVYIAKKNGVDEGVCVLVSPKGYGGSIDMIVGIGIDMLVTGVDIINQSETAGLGARVVEEDFRIQYVGKGIVDKVVKNDAKDNEINAVSSATITSKAVTKGVNEAVTIAEDFISE